jgi:hypothetical protein
VITVVSKVFLFGGRSWLYCSGVMLEDGVYSGWTDNGAWHLVYDTKTKLLESFRSAEEKRLGWKPVTSWKGRLTWMCYPHGFGYNEVIEDAKKRYKSGEEANYSLEPINKAKVDEYDDEVPF